MRNGKEMNSCLFGEELVAYIYDELPAAGRETFELHLLDCSGCTAELADISLSRLGVYEWHRDEFIPLETPHFVIPYDQKAIAAPKLSWIDGLRGFLSPMRLATAGGAFAIVAFAFSFGLLFRPAPTRQVASGIQENTVPVTAANEIQKGEPSQIMAKQDEDGVEVPSVKREFRSPKSDRRFRTIQIKNVQIPKPTTQATSSQSAPRLGNFVETEDKSLRLADLVADIDTRN